MADVPADEQHIELSGDLDTCFSVVSINNIIVENRFCTECGLTSDRTSRVCETCLSDARKRSHPEQKQQSVRSKSLPSFRPARKSLLDEPDAVAVPQVRNDSAERIGDRLVYDFQKMSWCCGSQVVGLESQVKREIPVELVKIGVSSALWYAWIQELEDIQKSKAPSRCCIALSHSVCLCLPLFTNHCLTCLPCCFGAWQDSLRHWIDNVNLTLNESGMHAKFLTYVGASNTIPNSVIDKHRHDLNNEISLLVIALTQRETDELQGQYFIRGRGPCCDSGKVV